MESTKTAKSQLPGKMRKGVKNSTVVCFLVLGCSVQVLTQHRFNVIPWHLQQKRVNYINPIVAKNNETSKPE